MRLIAGVITTALADLFTTARNISDRWEEPMKETYASPSGVELVTCYKCNVYHPPLVVLVPDIDRRDLALPRLEVEVALVNPTHSTPSWAKR